MSEEHVDERELLAAEYVLGTLDASLAEAVRQIAERDAELANAIRLWEDLLFPLSALAPPEAPPRDVWERLQRAMEREVRSQKRAARMQRPRARRWLDSLALWRILAGGFAAATIAALLLVPRPDPVAYMTVLQTEREAPAWFVEAAEGGLQLISLSPLHPEGERVLELWALPPGADSPTSLGIIPPQGVIAIEDLPFEPQSGMLIEVSSEPPGGSPEAGPTGPVLFIGELRQAPD